MNIASLTRILRALIPAERNGRLFVTITMIDAIGNGLFVSGIMVFALRIIRLDPQQITLGFSIAGGWHPGIGDRREAGRPSDPETYNAHH